MNNREVDETTTRNETRNNGGDIHSMDKLRENNNAR